MSKDDFSNTMFIISIAISIIWAVLAFFYFAIWPAISIFNYFNWLISTYYDQIVVTVGVLVICCLLAVIVYEIYKGFILAERKIIVFEHKRHHH